MTIYRPEENALVTTDDLVKRLRERDLAERDEARDEVVFVPDRDCHEAADRLEALEAERRAVCEALFPEPGEDHITRDVTHNILAVIVDLQYIGDTERCIRTLRRIEERLRAARKVLKGEET
jgi:hypothetical protein